MARSSTVNKAYKGHYPGSATGQLHECFDRQGAQAAIKLGRKLKLADSTVRVRIYSWTGEARRSKEAQRAKRRMARKAA